MRIQKQKCLYFLRDSKSVIIEVKVPSYTCRQIKQKFTNNKKWFFTSMDESQIWFYENQSQLWGVLQNEGDA